MGWFKKLKKKAKRALRKAKKLVKNPIVKGIGGMIPGGSVIMAGIGGASKLAGKSKKKKKRRKKRVEQAPRAVVQPQVRKENQGKALKTGVTILGALATLKTLTGK